MKKKIVLGMIGVVAVGIATLTMYSAKDEDMVVAPENLTPEQEEYCDLVDQWHREEMLDVETKWRWGNPDTKGTYDQWCTGR